MKITGQISAIIIAGICLLCLPNPVRCGQLWPLPLKQVLLEHQTLLKQDVYLPNRPEFKCNIKKMLLEDYLH